MANYMTMSMVEQEYGTEEKTRKKVALSFPNVPYKNVQVVPDDSNDSSIVGSRSIIGTDGRTIVNNPHRLDYAKCIGRIQAEFKQENENTVLKYGTGFVFADNWVMTTAFNIYDPEIDKFADRILYYPALGGNIDNLIYNPVDVTRALIHHTIVSYSGTNQNPLYNIAFLQLNANEEKPKGYCGFRYQYDSYDDEGVLLLGYPEELPKDAEDKIKGTYMYRGMGNVTRSDSSYIYHGADTSKGYEGAPMLMYWGDGNGYVAIGMNAYEGTGSNVGLTINRSIFGSMKMIRNNGMKEVFYSQPMKPSNLNMPNITDIFELLKNLGEMYIEYKKVTSELKPTVRTVIAGICNFLRYVKYSSGLWATALLDSVDFTFVQYVKDNNMNLFNNLNLYISESSITLKDDGKGIIDLAHMAATLEGYISSPLVPDFWTGWGADLATGMAKTTEIIQKDYQESVNNYLVTKIAYELIGASDQISPCNFSDFCSDFDAIKIAQMIGEVIDLEEPTGDEFANTLERYYTDLYKNRFSYIFLDLSCENDSKLEVLTNAIYKRMTGSEESVGLLPTFGNSPSEQVIQDCCRAMANYILLES